MLIYLAVEPPKFNKYFDLFKALRIVKSSKENKYFFLISFLLHSLHKEKCELGDEKVSINSDKSTFIYISSFKSR